MGGSSAFIDHSDAVGSTTMETDPTGGVQWKIDYYPWGQVVAQGGTRQSVVWAGLDWQVNDPSIPSATREYNTGLGRWLTPDPGGRKVVKLDDPQTWNMYAYALNNPTTLNDPSGLDVWLRGCGKESTTCHKAHWWSESFVGSWNASNTKFTRTNLSGDLTKSATLGPNGLSVKYNGKTYTGVWDTNKGEGGTVYASGPAGLTFAASGNCGGTCDLSGELYKAAGSVSKIDTSANASGIIRAALNAPGSGFIKEGGIYNIDPWHPNTTSFMGYSPSQPQGLPATHVPDPNQLVGVIPNVHVDAHYPLEDVEGLVIHINSMARSLGLY